MPHDIATLIDLIGGPQEFISRLDYLHTSGLTDIGNEPSFLTVFLYHVCLPHFSQHPPPSFMTPPISVTTFIPHLHFANPLPSTLPAPPSPPHAPTPTSPPTLTLLPPVSRVTMIPAPWPLLQHFL